MYGRLMLALALASVLAVGCDAGSGSTVRPSAPAAKLGGDWTRFGYDSARRGAGPARTGITAANVRRLRKQRVVLDGTVDASPIYLRGAVVRGSRHDTFFVTTSYGRTIAIDAATGAILWRFTPRDYSSLAGTYRITNSTPVADPNRRFVYAASPDGFVHKLSVASGAEARGWPVRVTLLPPREKLGTSLNFARGLVLIGTGGYIGDQPPYQGHVVAIRASTGRIVHVWNSLCSNVHRLMNPRSCPQSDSAIWARSGVVVAPGSGNLLVATGNGRFDGSRNWGDSALMLTPNASRLLRNWTPRDQASLEAGDVDLGSTAPAIVGRGLVLQSGKDAKLRLLSLSRLGGRLGGTGGELQTLRAPGGAGVFTAPAVWRNRVFVATDSGLGCYVLRRGRLHLSWQKSAGGTSPAVAGGLLYVYSGSLNVYAPTTGKLLASFGVGSAHWNSPIITDGRVAVPEGDANNHSTQGALDIFRLP
jgi:outer membrane protein assembly factor BamB